MIFAGEAMCSQSAAADDIAVICTIEMETQSFKYSIMLFNVMVILHWTECHLLEVCREVIG